MRSFFILLLVLVLGTGISGDLVAQDTAAASVGPRALSLAFRNAAKKATPSMVTVFVYGQPPTTERGRGQENNSNPDFELRGPQNKSDEESSEAAREDQRRLTGMGSGVIISDRGLVLTNNHVIRNAKSVKIRLQDGAEYESEDFLGDPESDVGIIRVTTNDVLPICTLGDSDRLEIGDWVLAIGSPFNLAATVSAGIISAKERQINQIQRGLLLQTDAAINPGNSGGPLVDLDGEVIGISTAIATRSGGYQGIGFAIPIDNARWIAEELDKHGKVRRATIGVRLANLKPAMARKFNLTSDKGALVYQVIQGAPGDRAGLKPLDLIIRIADSPVDSPRDLQRIVERSPIGSEQTIVFIRKGEKMKRTITIEAKDVPKQEEADDTDDAKDEVADTEVADTEKKEQEPAEINVDIESVPDVAKPEGVEAAGNAGEETGAEGEENADGSEGTSGNAASPDEQGQQS